MESIATEKQSQVEPTSPLGAMESVLNDNGVRWESLPVVARHARQTALSYKSLRNPQFQGINGLRAMVPLLDTVHLEDVWVGPDKRRAERYSAVVSDQSGQVYNVPTKQYTVVQNPDFINPLIDALAEHGIEPMGQVKVDGRGRTHATIYLHSREDARQIRDLTKCNSKQDPLGYGIHLHNSYDGSMGFGADLMAWRLTCLNGLMGVANVGRFHFRHTVSETELHKAYSQLMDQLMKGLESIHERMMVAQDVPLVWAQAEDILYALDMGERAQRQFLTSPANYAPELAQELTARTLFLGVSAHYSHREKGMAYLDGTVRSLAKASDLLNPQNIDKLIKRGQEVRQALEEKKAKKAGRKVGTVPALVTVPQARLEVF